MPTADAEPQAAAARAKARVLLDRVLARPRTFPPANGLDDYEPRATDVIVTTFPKSGTTMTQQLVYQVVVACGGAAEADPTGNDFDDICRVVPFVDFGPVHGFTPFNTTPRIFKSHFTAPLFKSTVQKHLVVIRDPVNYPASWLDFLFDAWADEEVTDPLVREEVFHGFVHARVLGTAGEGLGFPFENEDTSTSKDIVTAALNGTDEDVCPGAWFMHSKSWVDGQREGVLVMFYEDIVEDMGAAARRVARFTGGELTDEGVATVLERCDREYMSGDEKFKCTMESEFLGFGENAWKAKPKDRNGFKQYSVCPDDVAHINRCFKAVFGVSDYQQFRTHVEDRQKQYGF